MFRAILAATSAISVEGAFDMDISDLKDCNWKKILSERPDPEEKEMLSISMQCSILMNRQAIINLKKYVGKLSPEGFKSQDDKINELQT